MSITAIARDTFLKLVEGQVIHQLSEDSLTEIHPSLSETRPGLSGGGFGAQIAPEQLKSKKSSSTTDP